MRNDKLIKMRDEALITRYWYWTEVWQRRFDRTLETLEKEEFFISQKTIEYVLRNDDGVYNRLQHAKPAVADLRKRFPGYHWEDNKRFTNRKKQMTLFAE